MDPKNFLTPMLKKIEGEGNIVSPVRDPGTPGPTSERKPERPLPRRGGETSLVDAAAALDAGTLEQKEGTPLAPAESSSGLISSASSVPASPFQSRKRESVSSQKKSVTPMAMEVEDDDDVVSRPSGFAKRVLRSEESEERPFRPDKGSSRSASVRHGSSSHSDSEDSIKKTSSSASRSKKRKKRKNSSPEAEVNRVKTRAEDPNVGDIGLDVLSAAALGVQVAQWADELEDMRSRSKNLQGRISGLMKIKISRIKEAIITLVTKAEATGDPTFLRMRNAELSTRLKVIEKENSKLKDQLRRPSHNRDYLSRSVEKIVVTPDINSSLQEDNRCSTELELKPAMRPPIKGISKPVPSTSVKYTVDDKEREELMSKQIESLIESRKMLREKRNADIRVYTPARGGSTDKVEAPRSKAVPRIIEDKIIVPAGSAAGYPALQQDTRHLPLDSATDGDWATVVSGRERRSVKQKNPLPSENIAQRAQKSVHDKNRAKSPKRRLPRSSAITITASAPDFPYKEAFKSARGKITISDLDINSSRVRKAANGGIVIEISGPENAHKADVLADRLKTVFQSEATVKRPVKKGEVKIVGLDDSISSEEVACALADTGECSAQEFRVGSIRRMANGLGVVWVQCPLTVAIKAANTGKIKIGWTVAKIELLDARPTQCYKCWGYGHMRYACTSSIDRRGSCFNCGSYGHLAQSCSNSPRCVICHEAGLPDNHRSGSRTCSSKGSSELPSRRSVIREADI